MRSSGVQEVVLAFFSMLSLGSSALAAPIVGLGTTSVDRVDRLLTFDSLTSYNAADLSTYSENDVDVQVGSSHPSWASRNRGDGYWYANAGYRGASIADSLARVSLVSGDDMVALDFDIGSGGTASVFDTIWWETYDDGVLTGSSNLAYDIDPDFSTTFSVLDADGFDELFVGILASDPPSPTFVNSNVIQFDNLRIEFAQIPEPSLALLTSAGMAGLGFAGRRRRRA